MLACLPIFANAATKIEFNDYGDSTDIQFTETVYPTLGEIALSQPGPSQSYPYDSIRITYSDEHYWERSYNPYNTNWISITFSTSSLGSVLQVGSYGSTKRFPDILPGRMELSYFSMGFDQPDSRFQIFDLMRDSSGKALSFAASFDIYNYAQHITGRVWYNSNVNIGSVPEPSGLIFLFSGVGIILMRLFLRSKVD